MGRNRFPVLSVITEWIQHKFRFQHFHIFLKQPPAATKYVLTKLVEIMNAAFECTSYKATLT